MGGGGRTARAREDSHAAGAPLSRRGAFGNSGGANPRGRENAPTVSGRAGAYKNLLGKGTSDVALPGLKHTLRYSVAKGELVTLRCLQR